MQQAPASTTLLKSHHEELQLASSKLVSSAQLNSTAVAKLPSQGVPSAQLQSTAVGRPLPQSVSGGPVKGHNDAGLERQDALVTKEQQSKAATAVDWEPGRHSASKLSSGLVHCVLKSLPS